MPNGAPRALEAGRVTVPVPAVDWLLESDEPGIVAQARRDLLDAPDPEAEARVLEGPKVRSLLAGQRPDGGFGVNVYGKWGGAHWRLVSLVELGVPAGEPRCIAATRGSRVPTSRIRHPASSATRTEYFRSIARTSSSSSETTSSRWAWASASG